MLCLLPEGRKLVPVAHPLLCVEAAPQTPRPARFLAQPSTEAGGMSSHSRPWLPAKLIGAGEGVGQQGCRDANKVTSTNPSGGQDLLS